MEQEVKEFGLSGVKLKVLASSQAVGEVVRAASLNISDDSFMSISSILGGKPRRWLVYDHPEPQHDKDYALRDPTVTPDEWRLLKMFASPNGKALYRAWKIRKDASTNGK